jgi:hypothetical protein
MALGAAAVSLVLASKFVDRIHSSIEQRLFGDLPFWMDFDLSFETVFYGLAGVGATVRSALGQPAIGASPG